jgi:hypothetical protein
MSAIDEISDFELKATLERFVLASRLPTAPELVGAEHFATPELHDLGRAGATADKAQRTAVIAALAEALGDMAPMGAARTAVFIGAAIEGGFDAAVSAPAIAARFTRWVDELHAIFHRASDDAQFESLLELAASDEERELTAASELMGRGVVAHLRAHAPSRERLRADGAFRERLDRLAGIDAACHWVNELMQMSSGRLIVLLPFLNRGFDVVYENIIWNFQLFSLLQDALAQQPGGIAGAERLPPSKLALYRGEFDAPRDPVGGGGGGNSRAADNEACFHFGNLRATSPEIDLGSMVFGEPGPESIPAVDGARVLILWPLRMARCWNGFTATPIQGVLSDVRVERELPGEELAKWITQLGVGADRKIKAPGTAGPRGIRRQIPPTKHGEERVNTGARRPWWKFW